MNFEVTETKQYIFFYTYINCMAFSVCERVLGDI